MYPCQCFPLYVDLASTVAENSWQCLLPNDGLSRIIMVSKRHNKNTYLGCEDLFDHTL